MTKCIFIYHWLAMMIKIKDFKAYLKLLILTLKNLITTNKFMNS